MRERYSLHEAKSRLSTIIRQVRSGHPVIVTVNGEPAVEIRAIVAAPTGIAAKLEQMAECGVLVRPRVRGAGFRTIGRRRGALKRFLADRGK